MSDYRFEPAGSTRALPWTIPTTKRFGARPVLSRAALPAERGYIVAYR